MSERDFQILTQLLGVFTRYLCQGAAAGAALTLAAILARAALHWWPA